MHLTNGFNHSAQAVRKTMARVQRPDWTGLSLDLLGLTGLVVWGNAWIGFLSYIRAGAGFASI